MQFSTTAIIVVLWIVLGFQGLLIIALMRRLEEIGLLLRTVEIPSSWALTPGTPAPRFEARTLSGELAASLDGLANDVLLLFLSSGCGSCRQLAEGVIAALHTVKSDAGPRLMVFWQGDIDDTVSKLAALVPTVVSNAKQVSSLYMVKAFPTLVIINADGVIAGYARPQSYSDIQQLMVSISPPQMSPSSCQTTVPHGPLDRSSSVISPPALQS